MPAHVASGVHLGLEAGQIFATCVCEMKILVPAFVDDVPELGEPQHHEPAPL
jgi:hypothetical protein